MSTENKAMSTEDIAKKFSEYAKEGKWIECQADLFSDDAESIEPPHSQGLQSVKGREGFKQKSEQFNQMIEEVHGGWCSEPVVGGNYFSVGMGMDVTLKGQGRIKMDEIALYEVKDGKIVKEQFFY